MLISIVRLLLVRLFSFHAFREYFSENEENEELILSLLLQLIYSIHVFFFLHLLLHRLFSLHVVVEDAIQRLAYSPNAPNEQNLALPQFKQF